MTAKEELKQYKSRVKDVDRTLEEYEMFMERATKINAVVSEMTSRTNMPSDKVGDNATKMAELSKEYWQRWYAAEQERIRLVDEINKVGGVFAYRLKPSTTEKAKDGLICTYQLEQQIRKKTPNDL